MVLMSMGDMVICRLLGRDRMCVDIELDRRERLEEGLHHAEIDGVSGDVLANRHVVLLPQVVTQIARPAFVLHDELVSTFAAVDNPVQERRTWARNPTGFVAVVLGVVVPYQRLNLLIALPGYVGRVDIIDADLPLIHGKADLLGTRSVALGTRLRGSFHTQRLPHRQGS